MHRLTALFRTPGFKVKGPGDALRGLADKALRRRARSRSLDRKRRKADRRRPPPIQLMAGGSVTETCQCVCPRDPRNVGPYLPLGRLGSGDMGWVYLSVREAADMSR